MRVAGGLVRPEGQLAVEDAVLDFVQRGPDLRELLKHLRGSRDKVVPVLDKPTMDMCALCRQATARWLTLSSTSSGSTSTDVFDGSGASASRALRFGMILRSKSKLLGAPHACARAS